MVELIIGKKGSGKTKHLIESVNSAINIAKGSVVFISNSNARNMYDISTKVRMADTSEFDISSYEEFFGFICGIVSGNFDITNVFIDGIFKIIGSDSMEGFEAFLKKLNALGGKFDISFVITVSVDEADAPEYIKEYL